MSRDIKGFDNEGAENAHEIAVTRNAADLEAAQAASDRIRARAGDLGAGDLCKASFVWADFKPERDLGRP